MSQLPSDMTLPTINLNGQTPENLKTEAEAALKVAYLLEQVLKDVAPHGRDYQLAPEPDRAYLQAHKEWLERCHQVRMIAEFYQRYAEHADVYMDARKRAI